MTDVDQFEFQAKYLRYLATQQRVSDWVRGPGSQKSQTRLGRKPTGPRHITKSLPACSSDSSTKDAEFAIITTVGHQQQAQLLTSQSQIISPSVALISSALFVCAILPSLLTVSIFVVLLTYAGSLQVHVRFSYHGLFNTQSLLTTCRSHEMKAPLSIVPPSVSLLCNTSFIF
jgi:hypothetical protein